MFRRAPDTTRCTRPPSTAKSRQAVSSWISSKVGIVLHVRDSVAWIRICTGTRIWHYCNWTLSTAARLILDIVKGWDISYVSDSAAWIRIFLYDPITRSDLDCLSSNNHIINHIIIVPILFPFFEVIIRMITSKEFDYNPKAAGLRVIMRKYNRNEGFFFNQVSNIADIIHIVCIKKKDEGIYIFWWRGGGVEWFNR